MLSLLNLPTELLQLIAYHLTSEKNINAFCLTCHHIHNALLGYLYWHNVTYGKSSGLLWAAENGNEGTLHRMLQAGADLETRTAFKETPLILAAREGHETVVRVLLATKRVDKNAKDMHARTPLFVAAMNGHIGVIRALLDAGAVIECEDSSLTVLAWTASLGRLEIVRLLLDYGADPNFSRAGSSPLKWVVREQHLEVTELLLQSGADPNVKIRRGRSLLCWAAMYGSLAVVRLLLQYGALVDQPEHLRAREGRSALWWGAAYGHFHVCDELLAAGAASDLRVGRSNRTILSFAAQEGYEDIVRLLLSKGADPNSRSVGGWTPLLYAVKFGRTNVAKLLIEMNVDVNIKCFFDEFTPLTLAAEYGHEEVVRVLLQSGVDLNPVDDHMETPLSRAVSKGYQAVVKLLLENGADTTHVDVHGKSLLSRAESKGHVEIVQLLKHHGGIIQAAREVNALSSVIQV